MGGSQPQRQSEPYTVPVSSEEPGFSPVLRHPRYTGGLVEASPHGHTTMCQLFEYCFRQYANQPALGTKRGHTYEYKTYAEIKVLAEEFGAGLMEYAEAGDDGMRTVGIYGKNREEWVITDIGATLYGIVSVPLYDTLGKEAIVHAWRQTQMRCIVTGVPGALNTLKITKSDPCSLKTLIMWEEPTPEIVAEAESSHISILSFSTVCDWGRTHPKPQHAATPSDPWTISYTSGTTGTPKGAILSHLTQIVGIITLHDRIPLTSSDVHLSWLPLAHSMERNNVTMALYMGAKVCFFSGIIPKLLDEVAEVKPTYFAAVPRIWKRIHDFLRVKLTTAPGVKGSLARHGLEAKLKRLHRTGDPTDPVWDPVVFNEVKTVLGGHCLLGVSGGAPIAKDVMDFLKVTLCIPIVEGYGQTECPGGIGVTQPSETESGHVGGPLGGIEMKLAEVPDLGFTKATEAERRYIGEVLVRGPAVFTGYYKEERMTREAVDGDGWLHTGDIGILLSNGALRIIDRKKQIFKLSQGEYVAPEKIERVFSNSSLISQCWVYGDSFQDYCIAFVVPDELALAKWAQSVALSGDFPTLCADPRLEKAVKDQFDELAKSAGLMSFEVPRRIRVLSHPFTIEQDQITPTMKLKRAVLKAQFSQAISEEYSKPGYKS